MRTPAWLLVLGLLGCAGEHHSKVAPTKELATRTVHAVPARLMTQAMGDEVVGTVRARNVSAISPSVMGHVSALKVSLGSKVRAGDLLVQLSAEEIAAKVGQANATFAQAKIELDRAQQLKASQTIPASQYDMAEARFNVAKETLAEVHVLRGYTTVRAPFAGVITAKHCEVGDLAVPGKPLLVLESQDSPRLEAFVPEITAQGLRHGQPLKIIIDSIPEPVIGTVAELSPSADPVSRTVQVKLDLPPVQGLRPGMFGRLQVTTGEASTLVVPASAVVERGQLELVYVVDDGRAQLRIVRTGRTTDGMTELLSGLQADELVVVSEAEQLTDGQPIAVQP